jgi:hypothetical protein
MPATIWSIHSHHNLFVCSFAVIILFCMGGETWSHIKGGTHIDDQMKDEMGRLCDTYQGKKMDHTRNRASLD